MSEAYDPDNLLDRLSTDAALEAHDAWAKQREQLLLTLMLGGNAVAAGGDVLSVGAGWHPGRHLFPAERWRLTANDLDRARAEWVVQGGRADAAAPGRAGELDGLADASFDVVLYRLVLHHVVFQQPLAPVFAEAARLLRPGGVLVAVEPGAWHPVGAALTIANRLGLGNAVHGTPDDVPLSPRRLVSEARAAGLRPRLAAVTYTWRRLPVGVQRALRPLDRLGTRPRAAALGHTLMLVAQRPATS